MKEMSPPTSELRSPRKTSKTITLTQPGLIEQVIKDVGLDAFSKGQDIILADAFLYADADSSPRDETWNYCSVLEKLNYIANNMHPDMSIAVHQCAQFCAHPKVNINSGLNLVQFKHNLSRWAVQKSGIWASNEMDRKVSLQHQTACHHNETLLTLDMYVDSDFAGMWHKEYTHLWNNALSWTGYIIFFGGFPFTCASKLQTEIVSTTKSKGIALGMATWDLIPLRELLWDIDTHSFISLPKQQKPDTISNSTLLPSKINEDNLACIVLAMTDSNFKQRTKRIAFKFHHFKEQVSNGSLQIVKVAIDVNIADIFTKPFSKIQVSAAKATASRLVTDAIFLPFLTSLVIWGR
jgi:hypothetical protein